MQMSGMLIYSKIFYYTSSKTFTTHSFVGPFSISVLNVIALVGRRFKPGQSSSKGLLRDCEIFTKVSCELYNSDIKLTSPRLDPVASCAASEWSESERNWEELIVPYAQIRTFCLVNLHCTVNGNEQ